jgi:molecular chaperone DnaK
MNMSNEDNVIVGIDLGTGFSAISVFENGEPKIIVNSEGERTTPSIVSYGKDNDIIVGTIAKRQSITNPANTIFASKRLIGNKYSELSEIEKTFPYKVKGGKNDAAIIEIGDKDITPEEVGAKILQKLKKAAEDYLGHPVKKAVITCPAFFNDTQRQSTKIAGEIAGFNVERIVAEPTAAALAFGLGKDKKGIYAIFDFGSGTFDCSILDIDDQIIEVLSTNGDVHLGGSDLDNEIIKWMCAEFKKNTGIDLNSDKMAGQRLKDAAERAKIELSTTPSTNINIPFITANASGAQHLDMTLTRAQFEQMIEPYVNKTIECCKKALNDAGKQISDLADVLLVGGSTRVPLVQQRVKELFNREPNRSVNPDEVVSLGAAVQAGILAGEVKGMLLLDVCPLSLSIETLGGVSTTLIERNTTIPTKKSQVFSTAMDNQTSVEVVVLQGERKFAKDNKLLGRFHLDGIPSAPKGVPQIEVTYGIDANGILSVSAKDKATDKEQKITITASTNLSKEEIERMKEEAQKYEEDDKKRLEEVTIRNNADAFVFTLEKTLTENESKLPDEIKADIWVKIENIKELLKGSDYTAIKTAHDELMQASFKMSEAIYKDTNNGIPNVETSSDQSGNVVDAEVVG